MSRAESAHYPPLHTTLAVSRARRTCELAPHHVYLQASAAEVLADSYPRAPITLTLIRELPATQRASPARARVCASVLYRLIVSRRQRQTGNPESHGPPCCRGLRPPQAGQVHATHASGRSPRLPCSPFWSLLRERRARESGRSRQLACLHHFTRAIPDCYLPAHLRAAPRRR